MVQWLGWFGAALFLETSILWNILSYDLYRLDDLYAFCWIDVWWCVLILWFLDWALGMSVCWERRFLSFSSLIHETPEVEHGSLVVSTCQVWHVENTPFSKFSCLRCVPSLPLAPWRFETTKSGGFPNPYGWRAPLRVLSTRWRASLWARCSAPPAWHLRTNHGWMDNDCRISSERTHNLYACIIYV